MRTVALVVALALASSPVLAAPTGTAQAVAPRTELQPGEVRFHLEIEGLRRNTPALFKLVEYDHEGAIVCEDPCGVPVPTSDRYEVRGVGEHTMLSTKKFKLDPRTKDVTGTVRTARRRLLSATA